MNLKNGVHLLNKFSSRKFLLNCTALGCYVIFVRISKF